MMRSFIFVKKCSNNTCMQFSNTRLLSSNRSGNLSEVNFNNFMNMIAHSTSPVPELSSLPPHIGDEPGRTKEEPRITCMRMGMLRTPPFFPPKSGEKPYLEVLSRFCLWRDFLGDNIPATISAFRLIKNMSINPRSVEFHQCHAKLTTFDFFFIRYQR